VIGDPLEGRFFIWSEDGDEASARAYGPAASPQRAAECRAGDDWLAGETRWPRRYRVRCDVTGSTWSVEVTVAMQPSFVTMRSHEVLMEPSTHVLWGGDVLCKDRRLRGVPGDWPDGQRWISLQAVADGAVSPDDGCAKCWSAAPALVLGIQQIGDFYPVEDQK
jgi:hypothetical protein